MDKFLELFSQDQVMEPATPESFGQSTEFMFDSNGQTPVYDPINNFEDAFAATAAQSLDSTLSIDPKATMLNDDSAATTVSTATATIADLNLPSHSSSITPSPDYSRASSQSSRERKRKGSSDTECSTASPHEPSMQDTGIFPGDGLGKAVADNSAFFDSEIPIGTPFDTLSLDPLSEQAMSNTFDFESASSSPGALGRPIGNSTGTERPTKFFLGSRDTSPIRASASQDFQQHQFKQEFQQPMQIPVLQAPPASFFQATPPVAAGVADVPQPWDANQGNMGWSSAITSVPAPLPNPVPVNHVAMPVPDLTPASKYDGVRLFIEPISPKSRVETQILIKMTLSSMPPGVKKLHLPTHSISKPKLLAKTAEKSPDTVELSTMLVCTSAMEKEDLKERALRRARGEPDFESKKASKARANRPIDGYDEHERPAEGGEVRICQNCINRERKRAARKKPKNEEEEDRWNSYEADRAIVFNSVEYRDWGVCKMEDKFTAQGPAPAGTNSFLHAEVPMRIACYCRHQGEKIGFRVIITLKDHEDILIAQQWTESILITDDHKTQVVPPPVTTTVPLVDSSALPPTSFRPMGQNDHSISLPHRPYHSTNDLQNFHAYQPPRYLSQTSLYDAANSMPNRSGGTGRFRLGSRSREASPSAQMGTRKKRKASPSRGRVLADLTMTPQVSTSQTAVATAAAGPSTAAANSAAANTTMTPVTLVPVNQAQMNGGPTSLPATGLDYTTSPYQAYLFLVPTRPTHHMSEPSTPSAFVDIGGGGFNFQNSFQQQHQQQQQQVPPLPPQHQQPQMPLFQSEPMFFQPTPGPSGIPSRVRTGPPTPTTPSISAFPARSASFGNLPQHFAMSNMDAPDPGPE